MCRRAPNAGPNAASSQELKDSESDSESEQEKTAFTPNVTPMSSDNLEAVQEAARAGEGAPLGQSGGAPATAAVPSNSVDIFIGGRSAPDGPRPVYSLEPLLAEAVRSARMPDPNGKTPDPADVAALVRRMVRLYKRRYAWCATWQWEDPLGLWHDYPPDAQVELGAAQRRGLDTLDVSLKIWGDDDWVKVSLQDPMSHIQTREQESMAPCRVRLALFRCALDTQAERPMAVFRRSGYVVPTPFLKFKEFGLVLMKIEFLRSI